MRPDERLVALPIAGGADMANRLRNNFLHGEKARYGFRGQYDNFRHANNVLVAALELWPRPN